MSNDGRKKTVLGVSLGTFVVIIAMYGAQFFEALKAVPEVLAVYSESLPLGSGSFFMALLLAMGTWGMAVRYWPRRGSGWGADFRSELCALGVGLVAMLVQAAEGSSLTVLKAVLLGLVAGLLAPWLTKGVLALVGLVFKQESDGDSG